MKSVVLFGILSFLVIFAVVFLVTGVFSGLKRASEEKTETEDVTEQLDDEFALERKSLTARTEDITRREEMIGDLEETLELEKAVLAEEFNKLNSMRNRVESMAGLVEENKAKSLRKLAKMYEAMPPEDAATILSGIEGDIVIDLLKLMKDRPAAKIMAELDPARAAALSNMMTAEEGN
ncbi:MAG: hypothetical protein GY835_20015 [bacterium]|nr:hypothetical protein [bacterium]